MEQSNLPNQEVTGMYKFDDNEIIFNEDWVLRSDWTEVNHYSFSRDETRLPRVTVLEPEQGNQKKQ